MKVNPKNRHLLVDLIEEEQDDSSTVLLPDDYKPMKEFTTAKVLALDPAISESFSEGTLVVAETQMFKKLAIEGKEYYLLQANYALCEVVE